MKALGYRTVFFHPYLASGWNRRAVYQDFGFDEISFQEAVSDPDYMRGYITDRSSYEHLVQLYEEKEPGEPLFLFNVTMQNHSAYNVPVSYTHLLGALSAGGGGSAWCADFFPGLC